MFASWRGPKEWINYVPLKKLPECSEFVGSSLLDLSPKNQKKTR